MEATIESSVETPKVLSHSSVTSVEKFIRDNLPKFDRPVLKVSLSKVSPSYWRVNVWGRKKDSACTFGDNEIITSKFVRIDVDKDGQYVYNDVTEGKGL